MVSIAVAGRSHDLSTDAEVIQLPQDVRRSSVPGGLDGDSALCLIEIRHALHRASVSLDSMGPGTLAQSWMGRGQEQNVDGNTPEGVEPDTVQGNINKAIALVDGLNEACSAQPGHGEARPPVVAARVSGSRRANGAHGVATEGADALKEILERIAGDLNTSVIRCSYEAALILQSALQFQSNHEVTQRISEVIELLDDNIREVRNLIFGFDLLGGHTAAVSKLSLL